MEISFSDGNSALENGTVSEQSTKAQSEVGSSNPITSYIGKKRRRVLLDSSDG